MPGWVLRAQIWGAQRGEQECPGSFRAAGEVCNGEPLSQACDSPPGLSRAWGSQHPLPPLPRPLEQNLGSAPRLFPSSDTSRADAGLRAAIPLGFPTWLLPSRLLPALLWVGRKLFSRQPPAQAAPETARISDSPCQHMTRWAVLPIRLPSPPGRPEAAPGLPGSPLPVQSSCLAEPCCWVWGCAASQRGRVWIWAAPTLLLNHRAPSHKRALSLSRGAR